MEIDIFNTVMTTVLLTMAAVGGFYFLRYWMKDKKVQRDIEESRISSERENAERLRRIQEENMYYSREQSDRQKKLNDDLFRKIEESAEQQMSGAGSGGFIILELPYEQRSLFHDLLKGFEDYAKLRGYSIAFSIDNSIPNKIAFKFTIEDNGITVSTQTVRKDIKDYLDKLKNGDNLDEMPVIISPAEHDLVLTTMKNRISFLQHNYHLQKNAIEFYESFLKKLNSPNSGITTQPSIFVQTGGVNTPKHYLAQNSPQAIQGEHLSIEDSTINIAESFNDRRNQIDDLARLIELISKDKNVEKEEREKVILNLEKVKSEIEEENEPDKSRVKKWLEKAKSILNVAKFGKEVIEFGKEVYSSFELNLFT